MGRLIEVPPSAQGFPPSLTVEVGDVLVFGATGGQVRSGGDAVEILGALLTAVVGADGQILSPSGTPNTVLFLARRPGRARVDVVTGDLWRTSQTTTLDLTVEPSA